MYRFLGAVVLSAAALAAFAAGASDYPSKPIRYIVPNAPGGGTDITSRAIAQKLTEAWHQTVIVDNRAGATGNIGMELAARSAPDGYTIVIASATYSASPATRRNLPYDLIRDFAPVTQLTSQPYVLIINPSVPAKSVKELIAVAKARPEGLTYGSSGNGGLSHLSGLLLASLTGANLTHVPYKGGGPALADLLAGQINVLFATPLESAPHLKSGRVRGLAVSTVKRSSAMPELPTLAEAGVPGFEVSSWYGLLAPRGTPPEIIAKLNGEVVRVLHLPDIVERFSKDGVEPVGTTPEQFGTHILSEITKWKRVVSAAGIEPQ
jgi:tripartite-type tricarboxylate transporter receptor subunit TctC